MHLTWLAKPIKANLTPKAGLDATEEHHQKSTVTGVRSDMLHPSRSMHYCWLIKFSQRHLQCMKCVQTSILYSVLSTYVLPDATFRNLSCFLLPLLHKTDI